MKVNPKEAPDGYKAVKVKYPSCAGCVFHPNCVGFPCEAKHRKDGCTVIFIPLNQTEGVIMS